MANSTTPGTGRTIWQDRAALATLGLAVALNILLFVLVFLTYDQTTEAIARNADAAGSGDRFGSPSSAFILPIIGLVSWLLAGGLGLFYYTIRDQVSIAYTIWGVVVLIELATWVPVLSLITGI
jgi:hypothetical protein